jgi:hypothetical protein
MFSRLGGSDSLGCFGAGCGSRIAWLGHLAPLKPVLLPLMYELIRQTLRVEHFDRQYWANTGMDEEKQQVSRHFAVQQTGKLAEWCGPPSPAI